MKKITTILFLVISQFTQAQTTTVIDYTNQQQLSTTDCNIFAQPKLVQTISHRTMFGRPKYEDNSVKLVGKYTSISDNTATGYSIPFSFKQGYGYIISINCKYINIANNNSIYTRMAVRFADDDGGIDSGFNCTIPPNTNNLLVNYNFGYAPKTNYDWKTIADINSLASNKSFLHISAFGEVGSTDPFEAFVRKIQITEIPPPANFKITPKNLGISCGLSINPTFTINNISNTQNVTSYNWNLGATPNNWLYIGTAAPANIATNTNSISLTSVAGVIPKNVFATITANGINYNSDTTNIIASAPAITIAGNPNIWCDLNNRIYSVQSFSAATYNWTATLPNGTPSNNFYIQSGQGTNQVEISPGYTGAALLNCTATCNGLSTTTSFPISVSYNATIGGNIVQSGQPNKVMNTVNFVKTGSLNVYLNLPGGGISSITKNYGSAYFSTYSNNTQLWMNQISGSSEFQMLGNNDCGSSSRQVVFTISSGGGWGWRVSPNPAKSDVMITGYFDKESKDKNIIKEKDIQCTIEIYNLYNIAVFKQKYNKGVSQLTIKQNVLKSGEYFIKIKYGSFIEVKKLVIL